MVASFKSRRDKQHDIEQVRKISYGTRSELGRLAWENMLSIMDTCRKLRVSFYRYVLDIFSDSYSMPRLSDLMLEVGKSTKY